MVVGSHREVIKQGRWGLAELDVVLGKLKVWWVGMAAMRCSSVGRRWGKLVLRVLGWAIYRGEGSGRGGGRS